LFGVVVNTRLANFTFEQNLIWHIRRKKNCFRNAQKVAGFLFAKICNYGNRWCKEVGLTKKWYQTLVNWGTVKSGLLLQKKKLKKFNQNQGFRPDFYPRHPFRLLENKKD